MKKPLNVIKRLTLRWKTTLVFLLILSLTLLCVSLTVSSYSTRYYTGLYQQYNEQIIKEVSSQLDTLYSYIEELYLTFNSQQPFTAEIAHGSSVFQSIQNQILFEKSILNVIYANNLQSLILGTLFYLNDECYCYIGNNTVAKGFSFSKTEWYQEFVENGGKRILYGPITEDFKPANTEHYDCIYYIARYGTIKSQSPMPFILFTIRLDSLMKPIEAFLQDGRRIVVTDQNGKIIRMAGFSSDKEAEMLLPGILDDTQGENDAIFHFVNDYYVCSYCLNTLNWRVSFLDPANMAFQELSNMNRSISLIVCLFALISILIATILISRITMPLTVLNRFIDIMQEDPEAYIEEEDPNTEVGKIGRRLNEMKRILKNKNEELYLVRLQEKEAQVSALQAQINPHFLYNTLDNIYCIAQLGETEPILCLSEKLSQMMRYSMSMKQSIVPLKMELEHVRNYISILNIRFNDRIQLICQIPPEMENVMVLKLSLQPLVENAWQHGLLSRETPGGMIFIFSRVEAETLLLFVENNGANIPAERCEELNRSFEQVNYGKPNIHSSHGIALENINNRIKLTFGPSFGLHIENRIGGGCRVIMSLPLLDTAMHLSTQSTTE